MYETQIWKCFTEQFDIKANSHFGSATEYVTFTIESCLIPEPGVMNFYDGGHLCQHVSGHAEWRLG